MPSNTRVLLGSLLALTALTACNPTNPGTDAATVSDANTGPDTNRTCTVTLSPSANDQTTFQMAFVDAADHADICVMPGTYHFTDSLAMATRTGVTFRGLGATDAEVILDFNTMTTGERGVSFTGMTDVTVSNMTILDAVHDDLYFQRCTGVVVDHVVAGWVNRAQHGAYAIYPVESTNVLVDHCEAYGSADAGLYIGQTTNCIVSNSIAHDNVAGLEIENSTNCEVFGNTTHDNSAGILVFELPGLLNTGHTTSVHDNVSMNNNHVNFAVGGIIQFVPVGLGMMIMGAHEVEVANNTVSGNGTVGILLVDYRTAVIAGAPASTDPMYDGSLRHVYLHDNTQSGNSMTPDGAVGALAGLDGVMEVDVLWDMFVGAADVPPQLCIRSSGAFRGIDGPNSFANQINAVPTEAAACMAPVIPPVSL
jgi:parallel beta-helix repeat protein